MFVVVRRIIPAFAACMLVFVGVNVAVGSTPSRVVRLSERESAYAGTPKDWEKFLVCWNEQARRQNGSLARIRFVNRPSTGRPLLPAAQLPKSYTDFVVAAAALGVRFVDHTALKSDDVGPLKPAEIRQLDKLNPELAKTYSMAGVHASDESYFVYGTAQDYIHVRHSYMTKGVIVGKYGDAEYELLSLHPQQRTRDAEFEAALYFQAGAFRAPSFAELMRQLSYLDTRGPTQMPPYSQELLRGSCADLLPMRNIWWK